MLAEFTPGTRAAESDPLLPTIKLGTHDVTRLIIGGNPIYGYSHFNRVLSQAMTSWHTPDNVLELLRDVAARGINTWQNSYAERTLADIDRHRAEGGKLIGFALANPIGTKTRTSSPTPRSANRSASPRTAHSPSAASRGKLDVLTDLLKRIRDTGVLVGLSAHNPGSHRARRGERLGRGLLHVLPLLPHASRAKSFRSCSAAISRSAKSISRAIRRACSR
jgi:hypothetical protein